MSGGVTIRRSWGSPETLVTDGAPSAPPKCCGRDECQNPPGQPRSCPYQSDVHNDDDPAYCECCDSCAHECAMDI